MANDNPTIALLSGIMELVQNMNRRLDALKVDEAISYIDGQLRVAREELVEFEGRSSAIIGDLANDVLGVRNDLVGTDLSNASIILAATQESTAMIRDDIAVVTYTYSASEALTRACIATVTDMQLAAQRMMRRGVWAGRVAVQASLSRSRQSADKCSRSVDQMASVLGMNVRCLATAFSVSAEASYLRARKTDASLEKVRAAARVFEAGIVRQEGGIVVVDIERDPNAVVLLTAPVTPAVSPTPLVVRLAPRPWGDHLAGISGRIVLIDAATSLRSVTFDDRLIFRTAERVVSTSPNTGFAVVEYFVLPGSIALATSTLW